MRTRKWSDRVDLNQALAVVAIILAVAAIMFTVWIRSDLNSLRETAQPNVAEQSTNFALEPANDGQHAMFASFRLATRAETAAVQAVPDLAFSPAAKHVYVATKEFTLALTDTPFLLVIPQGVKWAGGPQGNVTFLKLDVAQVTPDTIGKNGSLYTDPLCLLKQQGRLDGDCTSAEAQAAASWDDMMSHMRHPTYAELKSFLPSEYHSSADPKGYLIATSDFRVAPEYRRWNVPGNITGILVPAGVKVQGGQLGYTDIITGVDRDTAMDTICFLYDADPATGPRAFVPAEELKRVEQGCKW